MDDKLAAQLKGVYCPCHNITYNEIALIIKNVKIRSIEELRRYMYIGRCEKCKPDIEKIIEYYREK